MSGVGEMPTRWNAERTSGPRMYRRGRVLGFAGGAHRGQLAPSGPAQGVALSRTASPNVPLVRVVRDSDGCLLDRLHGEPDLTRSVAPGVSRWAGPAEPFPWGWLRPPFGDGGLDTPPQRFPMTPDETSSTRVAATTARLLPRARARLRSVYVIPRPRAASNSADPRPILLFIRSLNRRNRPMTGRSNHHSIICSAVRPRHRPLGQPDTTHGGSGSADCNDDQSPAVTHQDKLTPDNNQKEKRPQKTHNDGVARATLRSRHRRQPLVQFMAYGSPRARQEYGPPKERSGPPRPPPSSRSSTHEARSGVASHRHPSVRQAHQSSRGTRVMS